MRHSLEEHDSVLFASVSRLTQILYPRPPSSPRGSRKKQQIQPTFQVTMPTGSRSLDKRTLASLVVVRHLGDADRRNM